MKFIAFSIFVISVFLVTSVFGQTAFDFEKKYGSGIYYEVRPKVLMTAEFDKNNQVCSVSLRPNRTSKGTKTDFLGNDTLDPEILKEIFDELVPIETRVGRFESLGFIMTGSMGFSAVSWDNVRFNLKYSIGRRNGRPIDASQKNKAGIDSLFGFPPLQPDLAFITWTQRTCVEQ